MAQITDYVEDLWHHPFKNLNEKLLAELDRVFGQILSRMTGKDYPSYLKDRKFFPTKCQDWLKSTDISFRALHALFYRYSPELYQKIIEDSHGYCNIVTKQWLESHPDVLYRLANCESFSSFNMPKEYSKRRYLEVEIRREHGLGRHSRLADPILFKYRQRALLMYADPQASVFWLTIIMNDYWNIEQLFHKLSELFTPWESYGLWNRTQLRNRLANLPYGALCQITWKIGLPTSGLNYSNAPSPQQREAIIWNLLNWIYDPETDLSWYRLSVFYDILEVQGIFYTLVSSQPQDLPPEILPCRKVYHNDSAAVESDAVEPDGVEPDAADQDESDLESHPFDENYGHFIGYAESQVAKDPRYTLGLLTSHQQQIENFPHWAYVSRALFGPQAQVTFQPATTHRALAPVVLLALQHHQVTTEFKLPEVGIAWIKRGYHRIVNGANLINLLGHSQPLLEKFLCRSDMVKLRGHLASLVPETYAKRCTLLAMPGNILTWGMIDRRNKRQLLFAFQAYASQHNLTRSNSDFNPKLLFPSETQWLALYDGLYSASPMVADCDPDWTVADFPSLPLQVATTLMAYFKAQAIDREVASELTDEDLQQAGIELVGHRKRALRDLKAMTSTTMGPVAALGDLKVTTLTTS